MTETDQEASAPANNVTHMCIPGEVPVENHTQVPHRMALLNGLPTDPYADRGEVAGVLLGSIFIFNSSLYLTGKDSLQADS